MGTPPSDVTLRVDRLGVSRGGVGVLADLSLTVAPGTARLLRGPNGSGKTTLLRTLAGLQPAMCGSVSPGPDAIAYASHADGLKATLSVRENLEFWARVHGHTSIDAAVSAFALQDLIDRPAGTLSAGQKRRLGLARLCVTRRPIWLLDEPTVSLDTASVAQFAQVVRGHLSVGGLALIATHIDLGLDDADILDVTQFRARRPDVASGPPTNAFDLEDGEAFL